MEGAAKPSTSSGSGVTDGASGGAGAAAGASMEERFTDLCKVRMLTHLLRRLLLSVGLGLFTATWVSKFICIFFSAQGVLPPPC